MNTVPPLDGEDRRRRSTLRLLAGERFPNETDKALQACNDWLRLGPGRTLPLLLAKYTKTRRSIPPTASLQTLKEWSADFHWKERAVDYDAQLEEAKNAERQRVMNAGFANDYERVRALDKQARFLSQQIAAKDDGKLRTDNGEVEVSPYFNVWLRDVKQIGAGEDAERVDIVRFNAPLYEQFRGVLDDIAKEKGERRNITDLKVTGGLAITGDDIRQARQEVSDWEEERFGSDADHDPNPA